MKATTFTPATGPAEAFILPDPVSLTVGALVNRLLDRTEGLALVVIDQQGGEPRIIMTTHARAAIDTAVAADDPQSVDEFLAVLMGLGAPAVFTPGDEPGAAFEG